MITVNGMEGVVPAIFPDNSVHIVGFETSAGGDVILRFTNYEFVQWFEEHYKADDPVILSIGLSSDPKSVKQGEAS